MQNRIIEAGDTTTPDAPVDCAATRSRSTYRVYHLTDTRDRHKRVSSHNVAMLDAQDDARIAAALFRAPASNCEYQLVAEVEALDLEAVFDLTNTITRPWWTNGDVQRKFSGQV
ncbi:hypothetical protein BRCH_02848 [Candidatus Burkholderia brachyanthoides]|nr:hypothetical protein BRCH_02848 [Candidatus Burkholderia brachyanthoides]